MYTLLNEMICNVFGFFYKKKKRMEPTNSQPHESHPSFVDFFI